MPTYSNPPITLFEDCENAGYTAGHMDNRPD